MNEAYGHIEKGQSTLCVALDLSVVFDPVKPSTLRLGDSFGVIGTAREWISSYLTDRTQFVCVRSKSSVVTNCSCGGPQESVLVSLFMWRAAGKCARTTVHVAGRRKVCSYHCSVLRTFPQLPRSLRNSMYCTIDMQTTHSCTLLCRKRC